jgi:hypothetical protein
MVIVLQVAGIAAVLIGLVTIGIGIPVKEFSFGNTLILAGTIGLCTGMLLLGLSVVARELRMMARRLASAVRPAQDPRAKPALPPFAAPAGVSADASGRTFDQPPPVIQAEPPKAPAVVPPVPEPVQATPPPKPKRNLLFQSSVRRDRERVEARSTEPSLPPASEGGQTPPASFEDAWPKPDRARGSETPQRRASRLSTTSAEASAASGTPAPPLRSEEQPAVTVLKSGVVDGMAYSLYSDGSIEAQMPEGMMRFASIDELRAHLDHRP